MVLAVLVFIGCGGSGGGGDPFFEDPDDDDPHRLLSILK